MRKKQFSYNDEYFLLIVEGCMAPKIGQYCVRQQGCNNFGGLID